MPLERVYILLLVVECPKNFCKIQLVDGVVQFIGILDNFLLVLSITERQVEVSNS